jgi:hypothetical protein
VLYRSITSSAVAKSVSGMVRPSVLAVLRLMTRIKIRDLLHWEVGRLLPPENSAGVAAGQTVRICDIGSVAHQAAGRDEVALLIDGGYRVAERQSGKLFASAKAVAGRFESVGFLKR